MADIDYGKIIRRSIELIKRNKWLWVYGLTIALFSGSFFGGGSPDSFFRKEIPKQLPKDLPEKTLNVLGETTTIVKEWFTAIPVTTWVAFGIGIFFMVLLWTAISWIIQSWVKGGLIAGLADADEEKPVTLANTSPQGIAAIKHLILSGLISIVILWGTLLFIFLVVGGGFLIFSSLPFLRTIWITLGVIAAVLILFIVFIVSNMIAIYAERLIVLKNYPPWDAWKKGYSLSRNHFIPTVIMAIINTATGCTLGSLSMIVIFIVLGIPALILVMPMFQNGFRAPSIPVIGALVVLLYVFIMMNLLVKAVFVLFNFSNWNLLFKEIWAKENPQ